jgi:hypothetical protein
MNYEIRPTFFYSTQEILYVIIVIYNLFDKIQPVQTYIDKIQHLPNIQLYIVEFIYENQDFQFELENTNHHLKIKLTDDNLVWSKENVINMVIQNLLPTHWKYVMWINSNIEFESDDWIQQILYKLNEEKYDIVYYKEKNTINTIYVWACSKSFYNQIGKLFEYSIFGEGDNILLNCILSQIDNLLYSNLSEYNETLMEYYNQFENVKYNHIHLKIRYHNDETESNNEMRYQILKKHLYDPKIHLMKERQLGLLLFNKDRYPEFYNDIIKYFEIRKETFT